MLPGLVDELRINNFMSTTIKLSLLRPTITVLCNFISKCTKMYLTAGTCMHQDHLGEVTALRRPLAGLRGGTREGKEKKRRNGTEEYTVLSPRLLDIEPPMGRPTTQKHCSNTVHNKV